MRILAILWIFNLITFLPSLSQAAPAVKITTVNYTQGSEPFEGLFITAPSMKEKRPGVLLIHNWMGISDETKKQAMRMAKLGLAVFAVDVYGKGLRPTNAKEAMALSGKFKGDRALFRARLSRGLEILRKQPGVDGNRILVAGYCFGGMGAMELARSGADIKAAVSFHGSLDSPTPADGKNIKGRVVVFHGADDPYIKPADLAAFQDEMRTHKVDWTLTVYGGAVHSFTEVGAGNDPKNGAAYNKNADDRSFAAFTELKNDLFSRK